jgi:hypothetical protein
LADSSGLFAQHGHLPSLGGPELREAICLCFDPGGVAVILVERKLALIVFRESSNLLEWTTGPAYFPEFALEGSMVYG